MIKLLIKKCIPNYQNTSDPSIREKYGVLGGILGIICNFVLFIIKLISGMLLGSVAVTSDAFNNLSDMGSSVIAIISAKLSGKAPDRDHPFGHGRIEYVSSLIISFLILMVGIELVETSFDKILNPSSINFDITVIIILCLSVFVKLWMYLYNKYIGKVASLETATACATDSINDVISTSAVIIATTVGALSGLSIDGYIGVVVSLLIFKGGIVTAKETIGTLLGRPPKKETVARIEEIITAPEEICGIHDLIVHDYGPGRVFASVHAEVYENIPPMKSHEIIDELEVKVENELGIVMVIHLDPIAFGSEETEKAKNNLSEIIADLGGNYSFHDLRITEGEHRINVIFDLVLMDDYNPSDEERALLTDRINSAMKERDEHYVCVIKIEHNYI